MPQSGAGAPGWQLEGNAPLSYDTHIVDVFLQDYSRRLVEVAAIKPGDRVLDVACGTGVVTQLVANKTGSAGQVVGFDLNTGMLARARAHRSNGIRPVKGSVAPDRYHQLCDARLFPSGWGRSGVAGSSAAPCSELPFLGTREAVQGRGTRRTRPRCQGNRVPRTHLFSGSPGEH